MKISENTKIILNSLKEGILIIDKSKRIIYANNAYLNFLETEMNLIEGEALYELRPNAKLPEVVQTGEAQVHIARKEDSSDQIYFANMYPIFEKGEVVGGVSIIIFLDDAYNIKKALEEQEAHLQKIRNRINEIQGEKNTFDQLIAVSPNSLAAKDLAKKIAVTDATILLESESGTGKEVYARAICNASKRSKETFLAVNCASINSTLLESELFGYVGGAFTGAEKKGKIGVFEAARGGTLFLDEISEIDMEFQAKLLRVFQEKCIRPVGGVREIPIDVRIICACNANLKDYVAQGRFRKDLYYRLNTFCIKIPALRDRKEDIPALTNYFLKEFSEKLKRPISITDEAMKCLMGHSWPGNVRELRNILEFGAYLSESGVITEEILPSEMCNFEKSTTSDDNSTLQEKIKAFEKKRDKKGAWHVWQRS